MSSAPSWRPIYTPGSRLARARSSNIPGSPFRPPPSETTWLRSNETAIVMQPHTSAGRIPTARAYRYYVDHLGKGRLNSSHQARIAGFFSSVQLELSNLLRATSQLLADVTHYPAVVIGPRTAGEIVRAMHLVNLGPQATMVVAVTDRGRVIQQQIRFEHPVEIEELTEAERLLMPIVRGQGARQRRGTGRSLRRPIGRRPSDG